MKIGIDIDNTITATGDLFLKYCYQYDNTLRKNGVLNPLEINFQDKFDWSNEEKEIFNNEYVNKISTNTSIYTDAKIVINRLHEQGNEIHFITARSSKISPMIYDITYRWLKGNGIKFHSLIIDAEIKLEECIFNNIDIMIDDSYKVYKNLNSNNVNCILFKTKYNNEFIDTKRDKFVSNWEEFYKYIETIK